VVIELDSRRKRWTSDAASWVRSVSTRAALVAAFTFVLLAVI
jgi:hypothetical protein